MKVKYVWFDNPSTEKVYDTAIGYREHKNMLAFLHMPPMTEEEWNEFEKKGFEEKHANGLVLSYEIIEEGKCN